MRQVTCAVTQFACSSDKESNVAKAERVVREAAAAGAQVILLQELFEGLYWCQEQDPEYFSWAHPVEGNPLLSRFSKLAAELSVVLPVPFFERANNCHYNSVAVIDADGSSCGVYRKTHIPDGPGYQEKFYFNPGDTGFKVFDTAHGRLGLGICWDQWFPEAARALALHGAELILYPTAIGTEPTDPTVYSYPHWVRTMTGHAAANMVPVLASNRIGTEMSNTGQITFHGGSFIAGPQGDVLAQVGGFPVDGNFQARPAPIEGFVTCSFDLDKIRKERLGWGLFRDRRPEMYSILATSDGKLPKNPPTTNHMMPL